MKKRKGVLSLVSGLICACLVVSSVVWAETDVTSKVQLVKGILRYDRLSKQSYQTVSLKNVSQVTLRSPIKVVIDSVSPSAVTVANADGVTVGGKPYFAYPSASGQLLPAGVSASKTWRFANPTAVKFSYTVHVESANAPPVAQAGNDQTVFVADTVLLDGTGSTDADGDPLTFAWSFLSKPFGSSAGIVDSAAATSSFTIDVPGTYTVQLVVNDGFATSAPDTVSTSTQNSKPVANAGPDQTAFVNDTITLDGSGSSDIDGDPLTYQWTILSKPVRSQTQLTESSSVSPSIYIDEPGNYEIELIVDDGIALSKSDITIVSTCNSAPVANAGSSQNAFVGQIVTLDGSESNDVDNDLLSYLWSFTVMPEGSSAYLTDPTNVSPSFTPDIQGLYVLQLIVNDGTENSTPATTSVTVTVPECLPGAIKSCYSGPAGTQGVGICRSGMKTCGSDGNYSPCFNEIIPSEEIADNGIDEDCDGNDMTTGPPLPPDPATIAPALPTTEATSMAAATSFLYTGSNPIQTGMAEGTIELTRAGVIRGRVLDAGNQALPGVTISVLHHPEFGQTLSRADGMFDLAVNGGGTLTVNYQKGSYLPAQRQVNVPWQDYAMASDVMLIQLDPKATAVDLAEPALPIQVVQGNRATDEDGARQATILFPQGVQATMTLPDGTVENLTTLNVRATEYTVGENGPKAMPAQLPPTSGYTYCVELTVDEALAAGAQTVTFSKPVFHYVENFLGFPVGSAVPAGYYDRSKGQWIASDNGRVIKILSIINGMVELDIDGSNQAADAAMLAALGITDAEREQLATLYSSGQSLWRVPITHFSPWDFNWPIGGLPGDAITPNGSHTKNYEGDPCKTSGSIIGCESQTLGESIEIAGTGMKLHYQNDRVPGHNIDRTMEISLTSESLPESLKRVELVINVAGREFKQTFPALPNQKTVFTWDGVDAYGRTLQGGQTGYFKVGYVYGAFYYPFLSSAVRSFAGFSGASMTGGILARPGGGDITLWQTWESSISQWNAQAAGLGGWTLDVHHAYVPEGRALYLGNGSRRSDVGSVAGVITTVAGNGVRDYGGDGGPATLARLNAPFDVEVAPDGSLYVVEYGNNRVRKVGTDGIITTVAGNGIRGFSGDGGPATQARLNHPLAVAVGPDGSIFISSFGDHRVRKVGTDGIITTVAGNGIGGFSGDGGPATKARLNEPYGLAVAPDGSIYIADYANSRIRKVGTDGVITTVAGNGAHAYGGDDGPATQATLDGARNVALGPDGSIYIVDSWGSSNGCIRKVGTDGIIRTVAGIGSSSIDSGDGGPATKAGIRFPLGVAVAPDGSFYITSYYNRIRKVGIDGIITTVAGNGGPAGYFGDGWPATQASMSNPEGIALGPDGSIYFADYMNDRVRRIASALTGSGAANILIPAEDGSEIYEFNPAGKHLRTIHPLTGATLYQFTYDNSGHLATITDADGKTVTIEHHADGNPTAIIAPFGQRTALSVNAKGYLANIVNPAGETYQFGYTANGLLTTMVDPRNNAYQFTYDEYGRLTKDTDPAGGSKTLSRWPGDDPNGFLVSLTTALDRTTTYMVEPLATGGWNRRITAPDGTKTSMVMKDDGSQKTTLPDGTNVNLQKGPDPRFGMMAWLPSSQTITTGGLALTTSLKRTATLADPKNPLSLTSQTDTLAINGRNYTSVFKASTGIVTNTSPAGRQRTFSMNPKGQITQAQVAGLLPVMSGYDANGRLASLAQGTGADERRLAFTYNPQGSLQDATDSLGRTLRYEYDAAGRVIREVLPDGREVRYAYDANGNMASLTPPGRPAHLFQYTSLDQTSAYDPPDLGAGSHSTLYAYDLDRNLTRITRPDGQAIDFTYDNAGRLMNQTMPHGIQTYSYNATTGKLASIADPDGGSLAFTYSGALLTKTAWAGATTGNVAFTYDNDFRVTGVSVNGANAMAYQYDADSLLTKAGDLTLVRNAQNGLLTGSSLANVTDTFAYSSFGELAAYEAKASGVSLFKTEYTRDKLGRIVSKTETQGIIVNTFEYGYDQAGRLIEVKRDGAVVAIYSYDSNGNRLSHTQGAATTSGTYDDQDRLLVYGTATYTYTANGELAAKTEGTATTLYQYDVVGNLREVSLPDGRAIDYVIDAANRRVGKKIDGTPVQGFLYQDQLKPVAELDGSGTIVSRFVYATHANVPDYMIKGGNTYRIITDHLGSPRLVVDIADGTIAQQMEYDEFGRVLTDTNPGFQPFGFAGGLYDRDTGLVRFGARDYDPVVGRWTAKDPILFAGGDTNLFGYVQNDPVNFLDSMGLANSPCEADELAREKQDFAIWLSKEGTLLLLEGTLIVASHAFPPLKPFSYLFGAVHINMLWDERNQEQEKRENAQLRKDLPTLPSMTEGYRTGRGKRGRGKRGRGKRGRGKSLVDIMVDTVG